MIADFESRIDELLFSADQVEPGPAKLELLEEAVRLADAHQNVELGFEIREELIRTATFSGYPEKTLVAFSWRLAQCDRDPDQFDESGLLWEYKWVVASLRSFPQISRRQVEDMLEDMGRRYERNGSGVRPIHQLRCRLAIAMNEPAAAKEHYRHWKNTPRDQNSDCPACEQNQMIHLHIVLGKDEKALELAKPILRGKLSCAEIPHATYALVLMPLLRLGKVEDAMAYHHKGYRMISSNRNFVSDMADHILFLALTDNLARAIKLVEKHLEWALDSKRQDERFDLFQASRFTLRRLALARKTAIKLRLPKSFPLYDDAGKYDVETLLAWFDNTCRETAQLLDQRNGNDGYARLAENLPKLDNLVTPWPLKEQKDE